MTRVSQLQGPHTFTVNTVAVTAGTDATTSVLVAPFDCVVTAVDFVPQGAATANGTNYTVLTLKDGANALASRSWAATDSVAHTKESFTVQDAANVDAGDVLNVVSTHGGTGSAVPAGVLVVTVQIR